MKLIRQYVIPRLFVDIIPFYLLLMAFGWLATGLMIDQSFLIGAVINYFMLVFAFIINDIEDRVEDAKSKYHAQSLIDNIRLVIGIPSEHATPEGYRRFKNPFSDAGKLGLSMGYLILFLIIILCLYFSNVIGGLNVMLVAASNLFVGILYSYKPIRLKSRPFLDFISHAYLLAAVQVLYFMAFPGANLLVWSWVLVIAAFTGSVAGDFQNEVRDFEEDVDAGINNTAVVVGKKRAAVLARILYFAAIATIVVSVLMLLVRLYF